MHHVVRMCLSSYIWESSTMFTFAAIRPLRVLYFDGFSAAATNDGTLDLQNILVYGKADSGPPDIGSGAFERGKLLCEWGKQFGIEGFVREEATFEVTFDLITDGSI